MKEKYKGNTIFFRKCNAFFTLLHILGNNKCIPEYLSGAKAHMSTSALYVSFLGPRPSMTLLAIIFRRSSE
jgi:hypothetical protein